jgi:hypothetical protein
MQSATWIPTVRRGTLSSILIFLKVDTNAPNLQDYTIRAAAHQLRQGKHQDTRKKRKKLTSASWLRPVCGGFHNLILFNCAPFFASCHRHRILTLTCLDACRCAAYLTTPRRKRNKVSYLLENIALSQLEVYRRFGGTHHFHLQDTKIAEERIGMNILSRDWSVTIDGFWIGDRIYWTLWYSAWLHFTIHNYTYSHVFTSCLSVAASNGGRSPSSGFPNCPRASATSF